jgi:uncharacterized phage-associated protein
MQAQNLAKYIITFFDSKGDAVTNKKLQKLLYYVEAWDLVYFDGLIDEDFQAWVHGPVIPKVYGDYKHRGQSQIILDYKNSSASKEIIKLKSELINSLGDDRVELMETVFLKYGAMSSFQLELLSHSEKPWLQARGNLSPIESCNNIISKKTIQEYYSSLLL